MHFFRVVMIVRESVIDISEVETVPVGKRLRSETSPLDSVMDEPNGNATPFDVGFVVEFGILRGDDSIGLLNHVCGYSLRWLQYTPR